MDGLLALPLEVSRQILIEAVKVRGIRRAARLRFVCRSWNQEINDAMCRSGVLDGEDNLDRSPFWLDYLTFRILRNGARRPRRLQIIRQVAERLVAHSGGDKSDNETLRQQVFDICKITTLGFCGLRVSGMWSQVPDSVQPFAESDDEFQEALLASAAWKNNISLVQEILVGAQDIPRLVTRFGSHDSVPLLGWAIDTAAYRGNLEVVRILLSNINEPWMLECARGDAIRFAGKGNQREVLNLYLEPAYTSHDPDLIEIVHETTSIEIFDHVLPLCINYSIDDRYKLLHPHPEELPMKLLVQCFSSAVGRGDLALSEHLVQRYGLVCFRSGQGLRSWTSHVHTAAQKGYANTLAYVLENEAPFESCSLDAAIRHGNPECVRLLHRFGTALEFQPGTAFLQAVTRENEEMVRLLLDSGILIMDGKIAVDALAVTEKEGLSSMADLIRGYAS